MTVQKLQDVHKQLEKHDSSSTWGLKMFFSRVSDWSKQSTCHGLRYIFQANSNIVRRLVWLAALGAVVYFLHLGYSYQITRYWERRTLTKDTIRFDDNLPFPAVTICNYCLIRNDSISEEKEKDFLQDFLRTHASNASELIDKYGEEFVGNFSLNDLFKKGSVPPSVMFKNCRWGAAELNCTKHMMPRWFHEGLCYTFNHDQKFISSTVGSFDGLSLVLFANQDNYFISDSTSAGFKILVHDPKEQPDMTLSTSLSPGFSYYIAISKHEHKLMPAPVKAYGDRECMKKISMEFPMTGFHHYSTHACVLECLMHYVYDQCGCVNPIRQSILEKGTVKECDPITTRNCSGPAHVEFYKKYKVFVNKCACALPCESIEYMTELSFAYFPNYNYLKHNPDLCNGYTDVAAINYVRSNFLSVQIFFDTKIVRVSEQILEFPLEDLLTSIGGYLGLAVGASVFTLLEFVELIVILLYNSWIKR